MMYRLLSVPVLAITMFASCRPETPVPKPRGYFRVELPQHAYRIFDSTGFPFTFEYPVYGRITQDAGLNKEENAPYWMNINFPDLDATIFLSYKPITAQEPLNGLIEQSFKLSQAHDIRADYIRNTDPFITDKRLTAVMYAVGGNAASAHQFYITDNKQHFIRGALYFNATPNADSLRPANDFLKRDMEHLIQTIQFK